jgi:hypothetical protein
VTHAQHRGVVEASPDDRQAQWQARGAEASRHREGRRAGQGAGVVNERRVKKRAAASALLVPACRAISTSRSWP